MTETIEISLRLDQSAVLPFLEDAIGVVEGGPFVIHALSSNFMAGKSFGLTHRWENLDTIPCMSVGHGEVGTADFFYIVLYSATVDGKKVIFYDPRSEIVNYAKIDAFFDRHLPVSARDHRGRPRRADPMGFDEIFV